PSALSCVCRTLPFSLITLPPPPISTPFPYTTLFRSVGPKPRSVLADPPAFIFDPKRCCGSTPVCIGPAFFDIFGRIKDREMSTEDRKSTRLNSSHVAISYAVFCLKKKKKHSTTPLT